MHSVRGFEVFQVFAEFPSLIQKRVTKRGQRFDRFPFRRADVQPDGSLGLRSATRPRE